MYNDIYDKEQFAYIYSTLCKWLQLKIENGSIADSLQKMGFKNIALYGISNLGEYAYNDIKSHHEVKISCFVDRRYADFPGGIDGIPVCGINSIPEVDVVLVTPIYYFQAIFDDLVKAGIPKDNIISLSMLTV